MKMLSSNVQYGFYAKKKKKKKNNKKYQQVCNCPLIPKSQI